MQYRKYRKTFFGVLITAIVVYFIFDLVVLKQSFSTDETARALSHSYSVFTEVGEIDFSLRDNMQARLDRNKTRERESTYALELHFKSLKKLTEDNPLQQARLNQFAFLGGSLPESEVARQIDLHSEVLSVTLENVRQTERELSKLRFDRETHSRAVYRRKVIWGALLNLILMLTAGLIWWSYDRIRKNNEALLERTLATTEKTNAELKNVLMKKAQDMRSTVHDLKNPLGSIKGFSDLIEEEQNNPTSVCEMAHVLQRISEHTLALVNSLLETEGKEETTCVAPRPIDLVTCIDDVCRALKPQILQKRQLLECSFDRTPAKVFGDPQKLWDVFMNLIGNAIKFAPFDSEIEVRVRVVRNRFMIEIEDKGPGFSQFDKERAFDAFAQLSARPTAGESSSGLGLHISRNVIQAHGGSIQIRDGAEGHGTCVVILLPVFESSFQTAKSLSRQAEKEVELPIQL
jgi:signal transduction histidine kinase